MKCLIIFCALLVFVESVIVITLDANDYNEPGEEIIAEIHQHFDELVFINKQLDKAHEKVEKEKFRSFMIGAIILIVGFGSLCVICSICIKRFCTGIVNKGDIEVGNCKTATTFNEVMNNSPKTTLQ